MSEAPAAPRSERAEAFFADHAITVEAVLTDNAKNYLGKDFTAALGAIQHRRIRFRRPQTNSKVERFNRTLLDEWAYARLYSSNGQRHRALDRWLHLYNHHRGHTALRGEPPISRTNAPGQHIWLRPNRPPASDSVNARAIPEPTTAGPPSRPSPPGRASPDRRRCRHRRNRWTGLHLATHAIA